MSLPSKLKACSLGATAILTEIVSMRLAGLYLGQGSFAVNMSLALFFAGMASGAWLAEWLEKNAKPGFTIGLKWPLLLLLLSQASTVMFVSGPLGSEPNASAPVCLLSLFLPAFASSFTLPFLAGSRETDERNFNYCFYNLGGTAASAFAMLYLPALGMTCTLAFAITLTALLVIKGRDFCFDAWESAAQSTETSAETSTEKSVPGSGQKRLLVTAFGVALSLMLMEASAARLLGVFFGSGHLATSLTITLVLAGLSLGNLSGMARVKSKLPLLAPLTLLALSLCLSLLTLSALPFLYQLNRQIFASTLVCVIVTAALLLLPASYFYGNLFPLITKRASGKDAWTRVYFANLLGSLIAVILFPLLLQSDLLAISPSQLENIFRINLILIVSAAAFQIRRSSEGYRLLSACSIGGLVLVLLIAFFARPINPKLLAGGLPFLPPGRQTLESLKTEERFEKTVYFEDGQVASVLLTSNEALNSYTLTLDGKIEAQTPLYIDLPTKAHDETHIDLATLPFLFKPDSKDILLVGMGSGTTADTITKISRTKKTGTLHICEIEPYVIEANKLIGRAFGETLAGDARIYLKSTDRTFDLIVNQPSEPWLTGSASLYSREYLALIAKRLKPGGIVSQWLNLYALKPRYLASYLKTFKAAFEHVLVFEREKAGEVIILGSRSPFTLGVMPSNFIKSPLREALAQARLTSFKELAHNFKLDSYAVEKLTLSEDAGTVTDDNNLLANTSINEIYQGEATIRDNKKLLSKFANQPVVEKLPAGLVDPLDLENLLAKCRSSKRDDALLLARKLSGYYPNNIEIRLQLARLMLASAEYRGALKEAELAIFIRDDCRDAHGLGAIAALYLNEEEKAKALLEKLRQNTPISVILKLTDGILTSVASEAESTAPGGPPVHLGIKEVQASVSSVRSKLMELIR